MRFTRKDWEDAEERQLSRMLARARTPSVASSRDATRPFLLHPRRDVLSTVAAFAVLNVRPKYL